jgi:hypothetical protein
VCGTLQTYCSSIARILLVLSNNAEMIYLWILLHDAQNRVNACINMFNDDIDCCVGIWSSVRVDETWKWLAVVGSAFVCG